MTLFWLQDPRALFECFCLWPFDQPSVQAKGNALIRMLILIAIAIIVLVPNARRWNLLLMLVAINVLLGIVLYQDQTPAIAPASLLHLPPDVSVPDNNPYKNPMPYGAVPSVHRSHAPMLGERYGNMTEPSDGYRFISIPDRSLQAIAPHDPFPNENFWLVPGGDNTAAVFGPMRGAVW